MLYGHLLQWFLNTVRKTVTDLTTCSASREEKCFMKKDE